MFNSSDVFTIAGYDDDGFSSGKKEFILQINPEKFDIIVGDKNPAPGKKADGDRLVSGAPGKEILKWNFTFLIDNTEYCLDFPQDVPPQVPLSLHQ